MHTKTQIIYARSSFRNYDIETLVFQGCINFLYFNLTTPFTFLPYTVISTE